MSVDNTQYTQLQPALKGYWITLAALLLAMVAGGYCAWTMEQSGHVISGMNNSVIWGLPHVFAITLILAASGALNTATLSSVFDKTQYKPWARLSVLLSIALLIGGLVVLVLDLGRPDRLFIAMTTYNFRSIFSWNIFLYIGFIGVGILYLWMMLDKKYNKYVKNAGFLALLWRLVLTTGTGSIFGFLVGRSALDTAIIAPLFIAASLVIGTAVFTLVALILTKWQGTALAPELLTSLNRLLFWCLLALVYFSIVYHLTNLYAAEHYPDERFTLYGPHALLFWLGHVGIGVALPLFLLKTPATAVTEESDNADLKRKTSSLLQRLFWASCAALIGGMVLVYLVVIGSQRTPQTLFPGKTVTASTFGDMEVASYTPSVWEWGLGIGGVSLAFILLFLSLRVLPIAPASGSYPNNAR